MSSGSLKDLVKAVNSTVAPSETPYPLPEELVKVVHSYLDKHDAGDEHDFQRLHDELLGTYAKDVEPHPEKHGTFIAILRELKPALQGLERLTVWWDRLVRPTLDAPSQTKSTVADAREFVVGMLIFDEDEDGTGEQARVSEAFTMRLFDMYLEKTQLVTSEEEYSFVEEEKQRFVVSNVETILLAFGKRKPKRFLEIVDGFIVQKKLRLQSMSLLCSFVRLQGPHLYQILETPLLEHLIKCLLTDTSTTVISIALTTLLMFMPHIPNALGPRLPRLFAIYSRILLWDKFGTVRLDEASGSGLKEAMGVDEPDSPIEGPGEGEEFSEKKETWQKLDSSFENASSTAPDVSDYFTFLYGLYPLNFMSFIYKPFKYFERTETSYLENPDHDEDLIRQRTELFRQRHIMHPNFFTMTAEKELDQSRWMRSEPADVVALCIGLVANVMLPSYNHVAEERVNNMPESLIPTEDIPVESLLGDNRMNGSEDEGLGRESSPTSAAFHEYSALSPTMTAMAGAQLPSLSSPSVRPLDSADSPTLPPQNPEEHVQDMMQLQETLRGGKMNESVQSLPRSTSNGTLSATASPRLGAYVQSLHLNPVPRSPAVRPANNASQGTLAFLQREVMLLKNDLNFERYLKQQHLSHIGHLQRKHIKDSTVEAETQNMVNTNKALRRKLEEAARLYQKLKDESTKTKLDSKKWEAELNSRIKKLREEKKVWNEEEESVKTELANARAEIVQLRRLVVESEAKELLSRQRMQTIESSLEELDNLRSLVDQLNTKLVEYEGKTEEMEIQKHTEETALAQVDRIKLRLKAREHEREKMKRAYETKIIELESKLQTMQRPNPSSPSPAFQSMIDSALAASASRLASLKKAHNHLLTKYTELEIKYIELQAANELDRLPNRKPANAQGQYAAESHEPLLGEDAMAATAIHHVNSASSLSAAEREQLEREAEYERQRELLAREREQLEREREREYVRERERLQHHQQQQQQQQHHPGAHHGTISPAAGHHYDHNLAVSSASSASTHHTSYAQSSNLGVYSSYSAHSSEHRASPGASKHSHSTMSPNLSQVSDPSSMRDEYFNSASGQLTRPSMQHDGSGMSDAVSISNSVGSAGSDGKPKPPKIKPQSEIRIRGRGGVQNIGKKEKKEKEEKKKKGLLHLRS